MIGAWLDRATARERWMLAGLALLVLVIGGYLGVIEPLLKQRQRVQAEVAREQELSVWLTNKRAELARLETLPRGHNRVPPDAPSDVAALEASIKAAGLDDALTLLAPQASGQIEVAFKDLSYLAFMAWMRDSGIAHRLDQLSVTTTNTPDIVNTRLNVTLEANP